MGSCSTEAALPKPQAHRSSATTASFARHRSSLRCVCKQLASRVRRVHVNASASNIVPGVRCPNMCCRTGMFVQAIVASRSCRVYIGGYVHSSTTFWFRQPLVRTAASSGLNPCWHVGGRLCCIRLTSVNIDPSSDFLFVSYKLPPGVFSPAEGSASGRAITWCANAPPFMRTGSSV